MNINRQIFVFLFFSLIGLETFGSDTYIRANDANIKYMGRIDFTNPLVPTYAFPGITIKAKFNGTKISAVIKDYSLGGATTTNYYNVLIDEVVVMKLKVNSIDTLYLLADNLTSADHTVTLIKRTEASVGKSSFKGFVTDGTSLLALPTMNYKMEFIGDSWTCGYGNEVSTTSPNTGFHSINEDNARAWGYILAKKFDAEYQACAISGRGMYRNNSGTTTGVMPDEFDKIFPGQSLPLWNFSNYIPDMVLIHLGTNDFYQESLTVPIMLDSALYVNKYIAFVTNVRAQYGASTKVVCVFGNSQSDFYPVGLKNLTRIRNYISAVKNYFTTNGDNEVYSFELNTQSSPYGEDWHPTIVTHNQMANQIAPYIETLSGRTASSYQAGTTILSGVLSSSANSTVSSVFPNPTEGKITIKDSNQNITWSVLDEVGTIVLTGNGTEVNLENLNSGIYMLQYEGKVAKIVKK